jgi:hypothetical protein
MAATPRAFNAAATWVAQLCCDEGLTNPTTAHRRVDGEPRARLGRGAQVAIGARRTAVEAITAVKAKRRETGPRVGPGGRVRSDARSAPLRGHARVWLTPLHGRVTCPLVFVGERQDPLVRDPAWERGGADLVWRRGVSYRQVTPRQQAPAPSPAPAPSAGGALGVDLGIVTLATESEGHPFTAAPVHVVRARSALRRHRLQTGGTRNAQRRIRRMHRREARFQRDTTHGSSQQRVHTAVVARKARAREDLAGSRARTTVRRVNRSERHAWAFFHLRPSLSHLQGGVGGGMRRARGPAHHQSPLPARRVRLHRPAHIAGRVRRHESNPSLHLCRECGSCWGDQQQPQSREAVGRSPPASGVAARGVDASPRLEPWGC